MSHHSKELKDRYPICQDPFSCNSYPFCYGCGAWSGTNDNLQKQLDEFFANKPYKVIFVGHENENDIH